MNVFSTRHVAKMLGLGSSTLARYIELGKLPAPDSVNLDGFRVHLWTQGDIERARKLLPLIKNGRRTRHEKQKRQPKKK
jgi:predicted DNA-binding transcriptional regulator AlpA